MNPLPYILPPGVKRITPMRAGFKVYPRKIDLYICHDYRWQYVCSTNASKTLKDAKGAFFAAHTGVHVDNIRARFAEKGRP